MTVTPETHLALAKSTYGQCWDLLESTDSGPVAAAQLLTTAFASRFHWYAVGESQQRIIADWMVSRAAAHIGDGDLAVRFALLADAELEATEQPAWLRASVNEGLARAYAAADNVVARDHYIARANHELMHETDADDAEIIAAQIATVPSVD